MVGRDHFPLFWIFLALLEALYLIARHQGLMFKGAKYGAYTELFASLSPDITSTRNGAFIIPWGRFGPVPDHIQQSIRNGKATSFYDWCDQETKRYQ